MRAAVPQQCAARSTPCTTPSQSARYDGNDSMPAALAQARRRARAERRAAQRPMSALLLPRLRARERRDTRSGCSKPRQPPLVRFEDRLERW
eukprot:scaffold48063_cov28-Tisochrysis_lutea.AAC.9